jgi:hypothetical protein
LIYLRLCWWLRWPGLPCQQTPSKIVGIIWVSTSK